MDSLHGGITNVEADNCQEAFLCSLYTSNVYSQWRHMKAALGFKTERDFVQYLMENIISTRSDVMEYLNNGSDKEACRDWFLSHLTRNDNTAHHYSEAALSCDAMLLMMYGIDLYIKSRKIKSFLHFSDEAAFIQWVMLFVTSNKYQLNFATCAVNDRSAASQTKEQEKRGLPKQEVSSIVRDYLCKHCGFVSSDRKTVLNHMSQHSGEESRNVDNKLMKKLHHSPLSMTKSSVQDKSECKVCLRVFCSDSNLMQHILNVHLNKNRTRQYANAITHPGRLYVCDKCNFCTAYKCTLMHHWKIVHSQNYSIYISSQQHICKICKRRYNRPRNLHRHALKCHGIKVGDDVNFHLNQPLDGKSQKIHICFYCGKVFDSKLHLMKHTIKWHRNKRSLTGPNVQLEYANAKESFECKQCGRQFKNNNFLSEHLMNTHNSFNCNSCGYAAKSRYFLNKHRREEHCPPYACKQCAASFEKTSLLKEHIMKVHGTNVLSFTCQHCHLQFSSRGICLEHRILNHPLPSDKSYACNVCGKSFPLKRLLTSHSMKQHKLHYGYMCDTCGKTFRISTQWKVHMLSHTNERTVLCSQCPATFKLRQALQRHERIVHNKEKPFKCDQCSATATFGSYANLLQHKVYVHGMLSPYQCNICKKYFPCASHLENHAKTHSI